MIGEPSEKVTDLWIACHGYGQQAGRFIRHFAELEDESRLIIAPEALSRFYFDGVTGSQYGASWMTAEDRLNEMKDYINWLNTIWNHFKPKLTNPNLRVNGFGFSQGVATVCRWLNQTDAPVARLVMWAGRVPPEFDLQKTALTRLEKTFVCGNEDEFISEKFRNDVLKRYDDAGFEVKSIIFDGQHRIKRNILNNLIDPSVNI